MSDEGHSGSPPAGGNITGIAIEDEAEVRIEAIGAADIMLFDLA